MIEKYLLSIIVPIRNGIRYLNDTLDCLEELEQTISCEIIFQDCFSTDGTSELIQDFCCKSENRFHFLEQDEGQSDAINQGVKKAKGYWVTWLCADDILFPELKYAIEHAEQLNVDIVYGDAVFVTDKGATPAIGTEDYNEGILAQKRLIIQQPGTCILRSVWEDVGGLRTQLNWFMDYDIFLRMEEKGKRFYRYKGFVSLIRVYPTAKTSSPSVLRWVEILNVLFRSHRRKPRLFRIRPYIIYSLEYCIKRFGYYHVDCGSTKTVSSLVRYFLNGLFWYFGKFIEAKEINSRYKLLPDVVHRKVASVVV